MSTQLGQRGTTEWYFNQIRSKLLPDLLLDLKNREISGLLDPECQMIKDLLKSCIQVIEEIPEGGFYLKVQILTELRKFLKIYTDWNDVKNDEPEYRVKRSKRILELKKIKDGIAQYTRKNQTQLHNDIDSSNIEIMLNAFQIMVNQYPDIFYNIHKNLRKIKKVPYVE